MACNYFVVSNPEKVVPSTFCGWSKSLISHRTKLNLAN